MAVYLSNTFLFSFPDIPQPLPVPKAAIQNSPVGSPLTPRRAAIEQSKASDSKCDAHAEIVKELEQDCGNTIQDNVKVL